MKQTLSANAACMKNNNIILKTDKLKKTLEALKNPQDSIKTIHIAGTNGKGSVCSFLENILTCAGYKVGKFTSPNLLNTFDAISINGTNISKSDCDRIVKNIDSNLSEFELLTAVAHIYFKESNCDYVILETGLGGEGDATNLVNSPICSVLTKISYDHLSFLGNTLSEIAEKKCGIIKQNCPVITVPQANEVMAVIEQKCIEKNCTLIVCSDVMLNSCNIIYENFNYKDIHNIDCGIGGIHQPSNASAAIEAAKLLNIDNEFIKAGIKNTKNPARFELLSDNIIFDGAHNPDGINALLKSLDRYFPDTSIHFIIGMMKDKDINSVIDLFKAYNHDKISTFSFMNISDNERAENADTLSKIFSRNGFDVTKNKDTKLTVICGSLYLYKHIINNELNL